MWEDEGAWNTYADQGNDYSYDSRGDNSWYGGGGWDDSSYADPQFDNNWNYSNPYQAPTPQASTGGWQQDYHNDYKVPTYNPQSVSNPYAAQITSGNPSDQEMYRRFGGDQGPAAAMQGAHFYRGQPGYENDPTLRNAEHYAASKYNLSNPLLNTTGIPQAVTLAGPPTYAALKLMAQNAPEWMRQYLPQFLTHASPPSWGEVWSGMKPAFGR